MRFIVKKIIVVLAVCLSFGLTAAFAGSPATELYAKKCAKCHGADGAKTSGASGGTMLKGQSADEVKSKLMGYKDGSYGGEKKKTMMRLVGKLNDEQLAGLSDVIGGF